MIKYYKGDVFSSSARYICHQVNCQSKMGAGIAKTVHKMYPCVYEEYYIFCKDHRNNRSSMLGTAQFIDVSDTRTIVNLFGQLYYGTDRMQTSYKALRKALTTVHDRAILDNKNVAIPYLIGCALAGGDWNVVLKIITDLFGGPFDPTIEIWELTRKELI